MNHPLLKEPIAVIGMACRLPGADNLDAFWRMLAGGGSGISELPPDRLDRELYFDARKGQRGKTYSTIGGMIPERNLDRSVLPASAEDLQESDECHLIFAEVAAAACRHAGWDPRDLPHRNTGVYVGHSGGSPKGGDLAYATLAEECAEFLRDIRDFGSLSRAVQDDIIAEITRRIRGKRPVRTSAHGPEVEANRVASLVSRLLGLNGPSMVIDAACASSLVALALGALAVTSGQVDMALVGGASYNKCDSLILFSQAQSCSATGTRPFDENADGLISSEGYVAIAIKTLSRALADGNPVHAVIRGIGMSSDGRGRSLWAPRKEGQLEAIRRAYRSFDEARGVQYIEAHATSTQIGDATEMEALAAYFQPITDHRVPVGSVKSNIGHTLETAGLAGLLKTILGMQHGLIPPSINIHKANTSIPWDSIPLQVTREPQNWPAPGAGQPRVAAVNAFGIGGLNVHVLVEEWCPDTIPSPRPSNDPVVPEAMPIAIIGRGVVLPKAFRVSEFARLLASKQHAFRTAPAERWRNAIGVKPATRGPFSTPTQMGGYVEGFQYDWRTHKIPPKQIAQANPLQFMLLDAAQQALQESGYDRKPFDRARTAVVVGSVFGGEFGNQLQAGMRLPEFTRYLEEELRRHGVSESVTRTIAGEYSHHFLSKRPALLDETGSFTASTLASRLTKTLDLMGGAMAIDAGESSSFAALSTACDLLRSGACNQALCAGAQHNLDLTMFELLSLNGKLAHVEPDGRIHDGYLPGEGVALVMLKRLSDAERDGDRVLGVIHGIGAAFDPANLEQGSRRAAARANHHAAVQLPPVSHVEAAFGIPTLDSRQSRDSSDQAVPAPAPDGTLIQTIGHTIAAHGIASLIKSTIAFEAEQRSVAPQVTALNTCSSSGLIYHALCSEPGINTQAANPPHNATRTAAPQTAATQTAATRAITTQVGTIPGKTAQPMAIQPATPNRPSNSSGESMDSFIVRVGGTSPSEIAETLDQILLSPESIFPRSSKPFAASQVARLAIVVDGRSQLPAKIGLAKQCLTRHETRVALEEQGIFYRELPVERPRVAYLFPGQGSQYPGMMQGLVACSEAARRALADVETRLQEAGEESFASLAWENGEQLGNDIWATQLSMLVADHLMYSALGELGLVPDCVTGHSYGEFPAMLEAGVWDLSQAIRVTRVRVNAIVNCQSAKGTMLSVNASPESIVRIIGRHGCEVYISHQNTPQQTVVGGSNRSIREFAAVLTAEGLESKMLAVPSAFHTPLMAGTQAPLRAALDAERLRPPRIPFLSNVSNRFVAEPGDIRDNLVAQMVQPVRYVDLVQRLVRDGYTLFLEVGPQQVLTRLNRQIIDNERLAIIATDHPKRPAAEQLLRVRALLECLGMEGQTAVSNRSWNSIGVSRIPSEIQHFDATRDRRDRFRRQGDRHAEPVARVMASHSIEQFDATQERRERMRGAAMAPHPAVSATVPASPMASPRADMPPDAMPGLAARNESSVGTPAPHAATEERRPLETFLVDFIVEQTGYPPEIIELDWDLEADLGIDSIKKAQLFGELREFFDLTSVGNVVIDDYRTIRQILGLLSRCRGKGDWLLDQSNPASPEKRATDAPSSQPTSTELTDSQPGRKGEPATRPSAEVPSTRDLAAFLVQFVVDNTGYPPEIVDLDSDLEADLGIDSIKKAQLFGELREVFQLKLAEQNRGALADYRNLRQVLESLLSAGVGRSAGGPPVSTMPAATASAETSAVSQTSIVSESVPATPEYLEGTSRGARDRMEIRNRLRRMVDESSYMPREAAGLSTSACTLSREASDALLGVADGARIDRESWRVLSERVERPGKNVQPSPGLPPGHNVTVAPVEESDDEPTIAARYVLRTAPSPQSPQASTRPQWNGAALIVGANEVARTLQARLAQDGVTAHILEPGMDPEFAIAELERIWAHAPTPHLFLVSARDPEAVTRLESRHWKERRAKGIDSPFWLCQRWVKLVTDAGLMDDASLVGVVSLGGDFGFSRNVVSVESGAITGLLKSIIIESWVNGHRTVPIKIIDTPPDQPAEQTVEAIWRELAVPSYDVEIAWHGEDRRVVRAVRQPIRRAQRKPLSRYGTWICTGGARGITAYVAQELGLRFGARLHLIGTAPTPRIPHDWRDLDEQGTRKLKARVMQEGRAAGKNPIKAWQEAEKAIEIDQTMRRFAELGIVAHYHSCDVSDREALEVVLDTIRTTSGPIEGILHGAGVGKDSRFEHKDREKVGKCLAAKVDGTAALMELTWKDPIKYFVAFGSISGRFGANGHTDYSLANDMMAKEIDWYRRQRPEVGSVAFHWHAWGDVGMATKAETRLALEMIDMQFMPAREGFEHLIAELEAGTPETEVLITDDKYYRMFYPAETLVGATPTDAPASTAALTAHLPLLDRGTHQSQGSSVFHELSLAAEEDPFLSEHRLDDRPLLPLVIGLEFLAEGAAAIDRSTESPRYVVALRDVEALQGLRFYSDRAQKIRVRAKPESERSVYCELMADFLSRNGQLVESNRIHFRAQVELAEKPWQEREEQRTPPDGPWENVTYPAKGAKFYLGPPLRCLRKIQVLESSAWGRIVAPALGELVQAQKSSLGWILPSAALDACLFATGILAWRQIQPGTALPAKIGELRLGRRPHPGEACHVFTRFVGWEGVQGRFDFKLIGNNGDVLLQAKDYRVSWMS